jgi:hypothetical protein
MALGAGDLRGAAESAAVANAFRYFFRDYFQEAKKMFSGRLKGEDNPLPILFPEWWEWWNNLVVV